MSDDAGEKAMAEATALLGQGQVAAAEQVLAHEVARAEQAHGANSFEAAVARAQLGALMLALGDNERAVRCYRSAVGFDPGTDPGRARRLLTLQNELAMTLERAGRGTEAAQVYLDVLANRATFYGREHPGYAFGLEPYASFLARQGELERARQLAHEAAEILARSEHPRLAPVTLLRALIDAQSGHPDPFAAQALPDALLEPVSESLGDLGEWPPATRLVAIESLVAVVRKQLGAHAVALRTALVAGVQAAREAGAPGAQERFLGALRAAARERGERREEQQLTVALSRVAEGTGDRLEAERLLREGVRLANDLGDARVRCHALRQLGIFHTHDQRPEAETVLRTALLEAIASDQGGEANLTRVALGVYLQHGGRLDEARELLTEAVAGLDPATSEAFTARSHLDALRQGGGCGCGRGEQAYQATLESLVRPELPEGLLEAIELRDGEISVQLAREPTEEEAALLDRVLRQALFRLRQAAERA